MGKKVISNTFTVNTIEDGTFPQQIFYRNQNNQEPSTPATSQSDAVPSGWTDKPQGVGGVYKYEWVSMRIKSDGVWGAYSTPALYAYLAEDGTSFNIKGSAITLEIGDALDVQGAYEQQSELSKTEKGDIILGSATHPGDGDHYLLRRTDKYWDADNERYAYFVYEGVQEGEAYVISAKQSVPTSYDGHFFLASPEDDDAASGIYYWKDLGLLKGVKGDDAVMYVLEPDIPQFNTDQGRTKAQVCTVRAYKIVGQTKSGFTGCFEVNPVLPSGMIGQLSYSWGNYVSLGTNDDRNATAYDVSLWDKDPRYISVDEPDPVLLASITIPIAFDGEKGDDGESYYITTPFDSIMIAPNERTAQLAGIFSLFKKIGEGQPADYNAYYSIYKRSGSTYTLTSSTIAKSNSCIISETVDMSCEAVAVFAFDNQYSGTSPHTQAYIAKAEVMVIKESDLTQPNILKRTVFDYGVENIKDGWITDWRCVSIPTNTPDTDVQGRLSVRISASLLTSPQAGDFVDFAQNVYGRLKPSTWYTLSFYSFATHQFNTYLWSGTGSYVIDYNAGWYIDGVFSSGSSSIPSDGHVYWPADWTGKRHTITFKTVSSFPTQNFYIMFRTYYISTEQDRAQTAICMPKLELGQVATEYVPNEDDQRGKTGRFFYYSGFDWNPNDNTHTFVVNNVQVPYFSKAGSQSNQYYLFNPDVMPSGGAMTMAQMAAATTSGGSIDWNSKPWEVMTSDFDYIITKAVFAALAKLGSWTFNLDYMYSDLGLNHSSQQESAQGNLRYDGIDDSDNTWTPNVSIDAANGRASFGRDKIRFNPDGSGWLANKNIQWNANGNANFNGTITAMMYYAFPYYLPDGQYTIDLINEPHLLFISDARYSDVVLPSASTYDGIELQFIWVQGTRARLGYLNFVTPIFIREKDEFGNINIRIKSNVCIETLSVVKLKALLGNWYMVSGELTDRFNPT